MNIKSTWRALTAAAVVFICGCEQRFQEPRIAEPAFAVETKEPPYKSDYGDAPEDLAQAAVSLHMPGEKVGRLPSRYTKCMIKHQRKFDFRGMPHVLVAVWASHDNDCLGKNAVALTLHREPSSREEYGATVVESIGTSAWFDGFEIESQKEAEGHLEDLVNLSPLSGRDLPPWPSGQLQPTLDEELTFEPLVDPVTYEAVRQANETILCWKTSETRLQCLAQAERRRPAQITIFAVYGYNQFRKMDSNAATSLLLRRNVKPIER